MIRELTADEQMLVAGGTFLASEQGSEGAARNPREGLEWLSRGLRAIGLLPGPQRNVVRGSAGLADDLNRGGGIADRLENRGNQIDEVVEEATNPGDGNDGNGG
jgi:hypothetical protein